jgi:hypothetical protein
MNTTREQVKSILNHKIHRLSQLAYIQSNPNWRTSKKHYPYTLPQEVLDMVDMLGKVDNASQEDLQGFASFATTGSVFELACK